MQLDLLEIGKIVRTHGIKGAVKVIPYVENDFKTFNQVFIGPKRVSAKIKNVLTLNNAYAVNFDIIPDIDTAEKFKNQSIYIDRSQYADMQNSLYLSDLIGKKVISEKGEVLGELIDYSNYGASDILEIKCGVVTYSLPFVDDVIVFDLDKDAFMIEEQKFKDMRV